MSGERRYRELLKSLSDDNVGTVVIYGMGGIGKTWIAKQGYNHAVAAHLFDIFIWVRLSITCNTRHAQLKILHNLQATIPTDDQDDSSRGIIAAFLADKKFLLVLDDAWFTNEESPLEVIGIPSPNHGSKVIVTTRTRRAQSVMNPDVVIEPDSLSQRESWELFLERAKGSSTTTTSPHLSTVINKCEGIPLSIILIAGALRDAATVDQEHPLKSASLALGTNYLSIYTTMIRATTFSYNMLPGSIARRILLYCLLFPGDISVSVHDLVRYWIVDGLLLDLGCKTWLEAYAKGQNILMTLLDHGLLYKEDDDGRVRMHGVVREVAFDIGRGNGFCKRSILKQQVDNVLPEFMSISLDDREIVSLMDGTLMGDNLPELFWVSTLLLRGNSLLKVIPDAFFRPMGVLRVLDLSFTGIRLLPFSISWLARLQYLLLRECQSLEEIQHISSLVNLEVLDVSGSKSLRTIGSESFEHMNLLNVLNLSGTPLEHLPPLYGLHGLRQLYLSGCQRLKYIPHLESLNKLELLDISNTTFTRFPSDVLKLSRLKFLNLVGLKYTTVEGAVMQCLPGSNVPIEPLGSDNKVWLSITIAEFTSLHKDSLWENCSHKYHLYVSPSEENLDNVVLFQRKQALVSKTYFKSRQMAHSMGYDQHLEIQCIDSYPFGIEVVLNQAQLVSFNKVVFMKRLSDIGLGNMKTVKECRIERCSQVECVFYGEEVELIAAFGSLENLWISNLQNLQYVCRGMERVMNFNCLKHLYIDCCPDLISLFDSTLHLQHLEILEIKYCNKLESVFKEPVQGEDALPRLLTLRLWELPELNSICRGILPNLNNLKVKECPKLKKLPLGVTDMSPLVMIKGDKSWWSNIVIEDERIRPYLLFRKWERF